MLYLKQSTASQSVVIGPFVDDTDGATAETGLTIASTDIKLSKAGGTMASKNSGGGTHDANGWYTITLDATDTATVGTLQVSCKVAGALAVFHEYHVLEEAVFDALFAASAAGPLQSTVAGRTLDVTAGGAAGIDWGNVENQSTSVSFSNTTIDTVDVVAGHTPQTGDNFARLGAPSGVSISADIADLPTVAEFEARTLVASAYFDPAADTVANVTTVGTVSGSVTLGNGAHGGVAAVLTLERLIVASTTSNEPAIIATGNGTGAGMELVGGSMQAGLVARADGSSQSYIGGAPGIASLGDGTIDIDATDIAQILALLDDPRTEPSQGAPPVNPDLATKIDYLYKAWRNKKTQTADTMSVFDDAGTTVDHKATVSDDGTTATVGEVGTGP